MKINNSETVQLNNQQYNIEGKPNEQDNIDDDYEDEDYDEIEVEKEEN